MLYNIDLPFNTCNVFIYLFIYLFLLCFGYYSPFFQAHTLAIICLCMSPLTLNQLKHFALRPLTVTHCLVELICYYRHHDTLPRLEPLWGKQHG